MAYGNTTMAFILATIAGEPQDPLQQLVLYITAVAFSVVLLLMFLYVFMLIAKLANRA